MFSLTRHASQEFDRARIELLCRILTEGPLYEQLAMILAEMDDYATRMALEAFDTGSQNNMEPGLSRAAIERVQERLGDALIEVLKEEESEVSIEILPRPWGFDVLVNVEENL